jgi:hypothetical protein
VSSPDLHRILLHRLHQTGITYMVTDAVAAIAYGEPRMTNDVDVVVRLEPNDSSSLLSAFAAAEYYVPPLEVIDEERQRSRGGHFNIIHHDSALRADIYFVGDDPLHEWAMARRRTVSGLVCPDCGEEYLPVDAAAHALATAEAAAGSGASVKVLRYEAT